MSMLLERIKRPLGVNIIDSVDEFKLGQAINDYVSGMISPEQYHIVKDQFWAEWVKLMRPQSNPLRGGNRLVQFLYNLLID